ncbi:MAG: membrane protein insertion efficiency factor YidD [Rubrobacteraceae bacterium]
MKRLTIRIIKAYKRFVSPLFPPSCRFHPTCSQYTIEAIQKYGVFKGALLGTWRILRCNPYSKGGFDPVK